MRYRFNTERSPDGLWMVIDTIVGWPAKVDGREAKGLTLEEADELVELLNLLEERKRQKRG